MQRQIEQHWSALNNDNDATYAKIEIEVLAPSFFAVLKVEQTYKPPI